MDEAKEFSQKLDLSHLSPQLPVLEKVAKFITDNPPSQKFILRERGKLPYSVFKPVSEKVFLLKSAFSNRPETLFFQYPDYVPTQRKPSDRAVQLTPDQSEAFNFSFRVLDNTHIYNAVVNSCYQAGVKMTEFTQPNLVWSGYLFPSDLKDFHKYQKVNHFPASNQLGRKDFLWKNISRQRIKFPQEFSITPMSFILDEAYDEFQQERLLNQSSLYILKPVAQSCGRGIKIVNYSQAIGPQQREGVIAQQYIKSPHLINGYKYDLRVYVLVTSFCPLQVYVYNEGLVRFATEKYSLNSLDKKFVHLTNFSVNRKNQKFVQNNDQSESDDEHSSKWDFKQLEQAYQKMEISF